MRGISKPGESRGETDSDQQSLDRHCSVISGRDQEHTHRFDQIPRALVH
jgi:hypothetical protein